MSNVERSPIARIIATLILSVLVALGSALFLFYYVVMNFVQGDWVMGIVCAVVFVAVDRLGVVTCGAGVIGVTLQVPSEVRMLRAVMATRQSPGDIEE